MTTEHDTDRTTMLDIARDAIRHRAARDEYDPEAYDARHDPEGYITSLLTALRHWCHANNIDWDGELARAQGFYEHDLDEAGRTEPLAPAAVEDLACPTCGQNTCFAIEVTDNLLMFADGVVLQNDTSEEWGDHSYCRCPACNHCGTVYQFRTDTERT